MNWLRHLAEGCVEDRRRGQCLERAVAVDVKRGIVFIPTASPKYNFYGANRTGANLFGDCLIALNARTGKLIWYFQMVHHDIWDYDNATAPMLLTVRHEGKMVDVVAQAGKEGFVWVFNRETGEPLWPIEERAVPRSEMPGEVTWPTQPFPLKPPPFARQSFTGKDLSPFLEPEERHQITDMLKARAIRAFSPAQRNQHRRNARKQWRCEFPRCSRRPGTREVVCRFEGLPSMLKLELNSRDDAADGSLSKARSPEERGRNVYQSNCRLCHGAGLAGQPPAVPSLVT